MRVDIGSGVRLFFDTEGHALENSGGVLTERPTLLLLHGGPGWDHASLRTRYSCLADTFHVIYVDQRGHGRSDHRTSEEWNLVTWADDVKRFCDALDIHKPIVLGGSFGGFVALMYAQRHPEHVGKLVLMSTGPRIDANLIVEKFRELGGDKGAEVACKHWMNPSPEHLADYVTICGPLYMRNGDNIFDQASAGIATPEVLMHFKNGEQRSFDLRSGLSEIRCPTLIMAGRHDPVCPVELADEIAAGIPNHLVTYRVYENAGHGLAKEVGEDVFSTIRNWAGGLT